MTVNFTKTKWSPHCRKLYRFKVRRVFSNFWNVRIEFWRYSLNWDIFA